MSLVTYEVQRQSGATALIVDVPLLVRIENAVVSVAAHPSPPQHPPNREDNATLPKWGDISSAAM